jgi:putative transposase
VSVSLHKVRGMSQHQFRRSPGGVSSLGRQAVWFPKYRRRTVGERVVRQLSELLEQNAGEHSWHIVAKEVMPDHMHLFIGVGPADTPVAVVRAFKGRTARMLRQVFSHSPQPRDLMVAVVRAASVERVLESAVRRYIEHLRDAVIAS